MACRVARSHVRTVPSASATASSLPSGLKAILSLSVEEA